ncbi:alpha/beta hydrolase [Amycolatopsis sp. lyj-90]|uniref:alpha/beta hydrolase n=1 Tax=Amycolatopsis sp. lyj-90 TaxID=2789285 RepID=UPI003979325E
MSQQQRAVLDAMLRDGPLDLGGDVERQRAIFAEMMSHFPLPDDVTTADGELGGIPVMSLTAGSDSSNGTLLYFHGGAYAIGSARQAAGLTAELARRTGTTAISVDYSLAPEASFPAPVDEAVTAYRALLEQGTPAERIVFAGESAGAGLAITTAVAIKATDLPQPAAVYAASPWADLTVSGESATTNTTSDPSVTVEGLRRRAQDYVGDSDPAHPLASPVFADLTGLAPLLIQAGGNEILLDDATRLATRAAAAGVHVTLEITPDVPHVFVSFATILEEAHDALTVASAFIRKALGAPAERTA